LEATGIRKNFGGVRALVDASLVCRRGRITGLLGANGSGKSTISKIITGVYNADAGKVVYNGERVKFRNPDEARKAGLSMVFQNLSLIPDLTVWQNVVLGVEKNKGLFLDDGSAKEKSKKIIDQLLPGLDVDRMLYELNPGEMQIVEIAKAISENPKLLILDEPTAALEQAQVKSLFKYMRRLVEEGVSIIFTSHRMWEVMEICDDVTIFRNGENAGSLDFDTEGRDTDRIIGYITGESVKAGIKREYKKSNSETVLKVEKLNHGRMLKDVSFELKKGEILGIGGLAGQGQHELMHALAGKFPKLNGEVWLDDQPVKLNKPSNAIKNNILFVPGDRQLEGLFLKHSVYNNIVFPRLALKKAPFIIPRKQYRKECREIADVLSIKTYNVDMPVQTLSGGNQQKVVIGKWLSFDINVLLLADPAKGVDIGAKRDLYDYISRLVKEKDMSVVLYASDNEELIDYCDRLLIMYEGRVVSTLSGDEITDERIVSTSIKGHDDKGFKPDE
jgi:ribose transport system ATP-binding protein